MGIKEGNWDTKLDIQSNNELGDLVGAFNQMSGNLNDLYGNLEQKVKERTEELAVTEDVLKKKVEDLGELNKLMVNRELKIVEMKTEIENLKKQ